ncbi:hydrolase [Haloarcula litorea]|uniref:hydrolase n=1 Tax=Haloarcula litorea TaxID=3032579 RepID=UPI0023E7DCD5|nr:hydrolase [Halomicroarcula sp. GDY20]
MSLEWRGAAVAPNDEMPAPESWEPVTVPGRPAAFAGAEAVAYETAFDDPRDGDEEHVELVLEGAYAHTRVWCNGERVAASDSYVAPLRVELPDAEDYRVVVECRAPTDRFGGLHATDALPAERCVPGIWWGAELRTHPDPYVRTLRARPRVTDDGATVDVTATVVADDDLDDRLTISLRPEGSRRGGGTMDRPRVATESGRATVDHAVDVPEPALWWPRDRGEQARYVVRAKLGEDAASTTTGIRSVSHDDALRVNGERVPARGVTLLDPTPADVERAAEANANLVRVRAQGVPPAVVEACDEHGLLLWADLPLTGPGNFDADRGRAMATALVDALAGHPSFAAVGVHDEPVDPYADGLGSGLLDRLRFRWRAWRASYDAGDAERVAEAVDAVPTFPVVGPPGVGPDAVTLYPGWRYGGVDDLAWLCDHYGVGDVVGGYGAAAGADDAGQSHQARVVKAVAERLRRRETAVATLDSLRDAGDDAIGVIAADGSPRPAYEALAASYEPTQVVLADPTPGESDVCLLHDRPARATVTVEWDHDGDREQTEHTVSAFGRVTVGSLSLAAGDEVTLAVAVDGDVVTNEYTIDEDI